MPGNKGKSNNEKRRQSGKGKQASFQVACCCFFLYSSIPCLFFNYLFYFWLCWISVAVQRFSLVVVHWLLTAVASLAVEHRLSCAKLQ